MGKFEDDSCSSVFPSSLLSADGATFDKHLQSRSEAIKSAISHLFAQPKASAPDVTTLQAQVTKLLSEEKGHLNELEKTRLEKEQLEERLENASMRYMMAEKKLDRAKSLTVAKLERQATAGGRNEMGSGTDGAGSGKLEITNGQNDNGERFAEVDQARKEAVAASAKQQQQLEKLGVENEKLTAQVTALTIKHASLSDDDYAHTDLFKHLKSQHEDVIKRINDLEATNNQLREEATKSQAERTAYRILLEAESQAAVSEKEHQLAQAENDLARIRTTRDELSADLQIRKSAQDQEKASVKLTKQLAAAGEDRIKALESEVQRLRAHAGDPERLTKLPVDLEQLPIEELRSKYSNIEKQYSMLNQELSSMGAAYKRASAVASQKVNELSLLEEKVIRLGAEKSKADQKYFAAMKAKEARQNEVRTLRAQNSKSSDIVSQLKEAEAATRASVANLDKTVAELKDALTSMTKQCRLSQQQTTEKGILVEGLRLQVDELKKSLLTKDSSLNSSSSAYRKAEVEVEELKVKLAETKKSLDSWKAKGIGNQTGEYEMLRVGAVTPLRPYSTLTEYRT